MHFVQELFSKQAQLTPHAVAAVDRDRRLTYAGLEARSNQLAHFLGADARPDVLIGLCVERSLEMVVGLLGILKAGAAFVPLDPGYPADRLSYMIGDSGAPVLLTQAAIAGALPAGAARIVRIDADWPQIAERPRSAPAGKVSPGDLAYVIYTSGSTGKPKGVMIPHRALSNHMEWMQRAYPLGAGDVVLQKTPLSFDASLWEVFAPLLSGATLVLAKPGGHKDPAYLCKMVQQHGVTTLQLVPSMLRVFLDEPQARGCTSLKNVFSGGEPLTADLAAAFFQRFDARLHNLYGPTETCIQVVVHTCDREARGRVSAPIGRPISNTYVRVLDGALRLVDAGSTGELYVGGASLARGYLNRPDLTAERFVPDPFGKPGERLYRTGDLVRGLPDGTLEFAGRVDEQVKIRGYRVEPGEIEAALLALPDVRQAAVVVREDERGERHLVACVVPDSAARAGGDELRERIKRAFPEYMVPSAFVLLDSMPALPNGKIDRPALPNPFTSRGRAADPAPRSAAESALAEIWSEVLRCDSVGVDDDFFELGGTSLDLANIFERANHRFGTSVDLSAISNGATIGSLAGFFARQTS